MKSLAILLLIFSCSVFDQIKDVVPGKYTPGFSSSPNFIKNSNCFANTRNISVGGTGAVSRLTVNPLQGPASCTISGSSSGDKVIFGTSTFDRALKGQNCEIILTYSGDASKWKVYAERSSSPVGQSLQLGNTYNSSSASYDSRTVALTYPCGDLAASTTPSFEATASLPDSFHITSLYIGGLVNFGFTPNQTQSGYRFHTSSYASGATVLGVETSPSGAGLYSYNSSTGIYAVLKKSLFIMTYSNDSSTATISGANVYINGTRCTEANGSASSSVSQNTSCTRELNPPDTFYFRPSTAATVNHNIGVVAIESNPAGSYSTQNSDTGWVTCTPGTTQGMGTPIITTSFCRRNGPNLEWKVQFQTGTVTGSEVRWGLPSFRGQSLTLASSVNNVAEGKWNRYSASTNTGKTGTITSGSGNPYIGMSYDDTIAGVNPGTAQTGTSLLVSSVNYAFYVSVPIAGWDASNVITASFKEVSTVPNVTKPKTCSISWAGASLATACTASPCTLYQNNCGGTVTRNATGNYSPAWPAGTCVSSTFTMSHTTTGRGTATQVAPYFGGAGHYQAASDGSVIANPTFKDAAGTLTDAAGSYSFSCDSP